MNRRQPVEIDPLDIEDWSMITLFCLMMLWAFASSLTMEPRPLLAEQETAAEYCDPEAPAESIRACVYGTDD